MAIVGPNIPIPQNNILYDGTVTFNLDETDVPSYYYVETIPVTLPEVFLPSTITFTFDDEDYVLPLVNNQAIAMTFGSINEKLLQMQFMVQILKIPPTGGGTRIGSSGSGSGSAAVNIAAFLPTGDPPATFDMDITIAYSSPVYTNMHGVKGAMAHVIQASGSQPNGYTIKKLLKQIMDPNGTTPAVQKARTITQIWEAAAIENGYDPDEPNNGLHDGEYETGNGGGQGR